MGKFTQDATKLLEYVGGKENISAVTHCVTRMRFVLVDPSKEHSHRPASSRSSSAMKLLPTMMTL